LKYERKMKFRIIGTPRSGTNYTKYLIESCTQHECGFNIDWWKHAVIPALMEGSDSKLETIPTLIVFRKPVEQIASWYKFIQMGGGAISGNIEDISKFINSRVSLNHKHLKYTFSSPAEYWFSFYSAALSWNAPKVFLELEAIKKDPHLVAKAASSMVNDTLVFEKLPDQLGSYMARNPDRHVSNGWLFDKRRTLQEETQKISEILTNMTSDDQDHILSNDIKSLYQQLIEQSNSIG